MSTAPFSTCSRSMMHIFCIKYIDNCGKLQTLGCFWSNRILCGYKLITDREDIITYPYLNNDKCKCFGDRVKIFYDDAINERRNEAIIMIARKSDEMCSNYRIGGRFNFDVERKLKLFNSLKFLRKCNVEIIRNWNSIHSQNNIMLSTRQLGRDLVLTSSLLLENLYCILLEQERIFVGIKFDACNDDNESKVLDDDNPSSTAIVLFDDEQARETRRRNNNKHNDVTIMDVCKYGDISTEIFWIFLSLRTIDVHPEKKLVCYSLFLIIL